jgi:hypothetical protein
MFRTTAESLFGFNRDSGIRGSLLWVVLYLSLDATLTVLFLSCKLFFGPQCVFFLSPLCLFLGALPRLCLHAAREGT